MSTSSNPAEPGFARFSGSGALDVSPIIRKFGFLLEWFSFECRKVIGFAFATLRDWLKKFALIFHPIRSKTKNQ